jgi:23S rRNA pseudouridine1911/1915/1917 synthase
MSDELTSKDAPLVNLEELPSWILHEDENLVIINKPGWLVCHPSKNGPLSSLIGAVREYLQQEEPLHLVHRLDRETSGIILIAKNKYTSRPIQKAMENRETDKVYWGILEGVVKEEILVNAPLCGDKKSPVVVKQKALPDPKGGGKESQTLFKPLEVRGNYTLCEIIPITGRKHQIRVHAQFIGHQIAGDKLYGPDENLYLRFTEVGWTPDHEELLPTKRQCLHARKLSFPYQDKTFSIEAPMLEDMQSFWDSLLPE